MEEKQEKKGGELSIVDIDGSIMDALTFKSSGTSDDPIEVCKKPGEPKKSTLR